MAGTKSVADFMEIAAITAPKTKGEDFLVTKTLVGDDLVRIHDWMVQYAEQQGIEVEACGPDGNIRRNAHALQGDLHLLPSGGGKGQRPQTRADGLRRKCNGQADLAAALDGQRGRGLRRKIG